MTYNEIIKALECCANNGDCKECAINPHKGNYGYCTSLAIKAALDLINRLQADNEDIKFLYENLKEEHLEIIKAIKRTKAEAYKEFADRLKEKYLDDEKIVNMAWVNAIEHIDKLLKEMAGENNG